MSNSAPLYFEAAYDSENVRDDLSQKALKRRERKAQKRQESDQKLRRRHPLPLMPKTERQADYLDALRTNDQVFAIGGAGTGKTYIPARYAVQELLDNNISKIVLTRPTVSRPEHRMGFLPGSAKMKMEPWLVPLVGAMKEQTNPANVDRWMVAEVIEFVPFEHMRGRTFKDSIVILDEAQNCTLADLRLFLTRIGEDSRVVVTGDIDQVDIPNSGLGTVTDMIKRYNMAADIIEFGPGDVVRSKIAREWVQAFSRAAS